MKQIKTIRKLMTVLLMMFLLSAVIPTAVPLIYAEQTAELSMTEDSVTGQLHLRGRLSGLSGIFSVKVYRAGKADNPSYLGFDSPGEGGTVCHDFYLPEDAAGGTYIVKVGGNDMTEPATTRFTYTAKTPAEGAALIAPEGGAVLTEGEMTGFSLYAYHTGSEAAEYQINISENGTLCSAASITVNPNERSLRPIMLSGLDKGVHTLSYIITKNGTEAASGTQKVAVIEKYKNNYRAEDASFGMNVAIAASLYENEKELELMRRAGVSNIRPNNTLGWSKVETQKGVYNVLSETKLYIDKIEEGNFSLLIDFDYGNALYGENDLAAPATKEQTDAFCAYVQEVLRQVPSIKTVEVWNEPDQFASFWGRRDTYAVEYGALVKATALAVREVRDDVKILGGVVSSSSGGSASYIGHLLDQSIRPYIDGFSFHPYVNNKSVDWCYYGTGNADSYTKLIEAGGGWVDSYNTEFGYFIGTHNETYGVDYRYTIDETLQAEYLVKFYAYNAQLDVKENYWYNGRNIGTNPNYAESMYGVLEKDFTPKKAYAALSQVNCRLGGGRYIGPVAFGEGVSGSLFNVGGELVAVAWVPEQRDLSVPLEGCVNDSKTVTHTFDNTGFVLRDMYGNVREHDGTVTFTKTPVWLSGLSQADAAAALQNAVTAIGKKYNIVSGMNTITAPDFATATAAEVKAYINNIYTVAVSWINGTGSGFENRMKQADGFHKTAECVAAFYSYLENSAPEITDASLKAAEGQRDAKCGSAPAEALSFTTKMLHKAESYYKRAADIAAGESAQTQNGYAAADMLVAEGVVKMAAATMKYEEPDSAYGILVYTNPTYPTVTQYGTEGFSLTVDNRSGRKLEGTLTIQDANGVTVSPRYPLTLESGATTEKNVMLYTTKNTTVGTNAYSVIFTDDNGSVAVKKLWVTVNEGSGSDVFCTGFTDGDGNAAGMTKLPETITANFCISGTERDKVSLVVAVYDGDKLVHIGTDTVDITDNTISYSVSVSGIKSGTRVSAMALASFGSLTPLCPQQSLE